MRDIVYRSQLDPASIPPAGLSSVAQRRPAPERPATRFITSRANAPVTPSRAPPGTPTGRTPPGTRTKISQLSTDTVTPGRTKEITTSTAAINFDDIKPLEKEELTLEDLLSAHLGLQGDIATLVAEGNIPYPDKEDYNIVYRHLPRSYMEEFCGYRYYMTLAKTEKEQSDLRKEWLMLQSPGSCVLSSCLQLVNTSLFDKAPPYLKNIVLLLTPHIEEGKYTNEDIKTLVEKYKNHMELEQKEIVEKSSGFISGSLTKFDDGLLVPWFAATLGACGFEVETYDTIKKIVNVDGKGIIYRPKLDEEENVVNRQERNTTFKQMLSILPRNCCGCFLYKEDEGGGHSVSFVKEGPSLTVYDTWQRLITKMKGEDSKTYHAPTVLKNIYGAGSYITVPNGRHLLMKGQQWKKFDEVDMLSRIQQTDYRTYNVVRLCWIDKKTIGTK